MKESCDTKTRRDKQMDTGKRKSWNKERWMSGSRDRDDQGSRVECQAAISSSFLFLSCTLS
ncbi:hypothetical protein INR49_024931 [Caranx melampygus]|nr:hypothetical protein INR49_024931 [Caranx melampygus]